MKVIVDVGCLEASRRQKFLDALMEFITLETVESEDLKTQAAIRMLNVEKDPEEWRRDLKTYNDEESYLSFLKNLGDRLKSIND